MPAAEVPHGKLLDETMAAYERLLQLLTNVRSPELLEANVTMAQMKLLMLVAAGGELAMSEIGAKLGVSLSTVSGLVDRLVDSGYAVRRESREDRRQVLVSTTPAGTAFLDRFQELGSSRLRELLGRLGTADLAQVRTAIELLTAAAAQGPLDKDRDAEPSSYRGRSK